MSVTCATGMSQQAVSLADKDNDIVYVPDQPNFNFATGVTVAGWFNPTSMNQTRTLFRKRDDATRAAPSRWCSTTASISSSSTWARQGRHRHRADQGQGRTAGPHVAATYDGSTLRLYVNGVEVGESARRSGRSLPAAGPFLMGNDGSKRLFAGLIDEAFLDARALSATEVLALTCLRQPPTVAATPAVSAPTPAGRAGVVRHRHHQQRLGGCARRATTASRSTSSSQRHDRRTRASRSSRRSPPGRRAHVDHDRHRRPTISTRAPSRSRSWSSGQPAVQQHRVRQRRLRASSPPAARSARPRELMITNTVRGRRSDPHGASADRGSAHRRLDVQAPDGEHGADARPTRPAMVEDDAEDLQHAQTTSTASRSMPRPGHAGAHPATTGRATRDGALDLSPGAAQLQAIVNRFDLRNRRQRRRGRGAVRVRVHARAGPSRCRRR